MLYGGRLKSRRKGDARRNNESRRSGASPKGPKPTVTKQKERKKNS